MWYGGANAPSPRTCMRLQSSPAANCGFSTVHRWSWLILSSSMLPYWVWVILSDRPTTTLILQHFQILVGVHHPLDWPCKLYQHTDPTSTRGRICREAQKILLLCRSPSRMVYSRKLFYMNNFWHQGVTGSSDSGWGNRHTPNRALDVRNLY